MSLEGINRRDFLSGSLNFAALASTGLLSAKENIGQVGDGALRENALELCPGASESEISQVVEILKRAENPSPEEERVLLAELTELIRDCNSRRNV